MTKKEYLDINKQLFESGLFNELDAMRLKCDGLIASYENLKKEADSKLTESAYNAKEMFRKYLSSALEVASRNCNYMLINALVDCGLDTNAKIYEYLKKDKSNYGVCILSAYFNHYVTGWDGGMLVIHNHINYKEKNISLNIDKYHKGNIVKKYDLLIDYDYNDFKKHYAEAKAVVDEINNLQHKLHSLELKYNICR